GGLVVQGGDAGGVGPQAPGGENQAGGDGRDDGGREDEGAGVVDQVGDERGVAGDPGAAHAQGLSAGVDRGQHAVRQVQGLDAARATGAVKAGGVGLVDDDQGVQALGQLAQGGQIGQVPVHREDALGDDEGAA